MLWRNGGERRLGFVSAAVPPQTTAEAARSFGYTYGLRQTRRLSPRGRRTPFARDRKALSGDRGSGPSPQLASHPARFVSFWRPPRSAPLRALRPRASGASPTPIAVRRSPGERCKSLAPALAATKAVSLVNHRIEVGGGESRTAYFLPPPMSAANTGKQPSHSDYCAGLHNTKTPTICRTIATTSLPVFP